MANICSFSMRIKGSKENVKIFLDCLEQKAKYGDHELVWVGRGCELNIGIEDYDEETQTLFTEGWCKWSMTSSMVENAVSMRENPKIWGGLVEGTYYPTIFECAKELGVQFEAYSTEAGCCFAEHIGLIDEIGQIDETTNYDEIWIEDYETLEECQKEHPDVTQEDWDESDGSIIEVGGFDTSVWNL